MAKPISPFLFAVLEYGEFPELLRVADQLHAAFARPIVFFFVKPGYRRLPQDTMAVGERGYAWADADGQLHDQPFPAQAQGLSSHREERARTEPALQGVPPGQRKTSTIYRRLLAAVWLPAYVMSYALLGAAKALRPCAREVVNCLRDVRRFRSKYGVMAAVLDKLHPALVVVGQDTPGSELPLLLVAAGRRGIPRLITPFAMFALQETADYAKARPEHHAAGSALNALVARVFPHWVLDWKGERVLRLPGFRALALEMLGLTRGMPWSPLTEPVEAVTAESEIAADALSVQGLPRHRVRVVGSPVHDSIAAFLSDRIALRAKICAEFGMDPARPLVVCGWPANLFAWLAGRTIGFPDYSSLASAWASALAGVRDRFSVNVVVSVHPKTLPEEYKPAVDAGLPCRISGADELIAACDLFTTLNGSSITAWAIAAGVPVLLFDCFNTRYTDFYTVPGCICVDTEEDFLRRLDELCANDGLRADLAEKQRRVSMNWGVLDGQASARMVEIVSNLLRHDVGD